MKVTASIWTGPTQVKEIAARLGQGAFAGTEKVYCVFQVPDDMQEFEGRELVTREFIKRFREAGFGTDSGFNETDVRLVRFE